MNLAPEKIYHLYNRGNNQQNIFLQERNYEFFKNKFLKQLSTQVDILAYCLMPNHFHFLISSKTEFDQTKFSSGLRVLLSSYTRALQKQEGFVGSLFQQNSKIKEVSNDRYALNCFHYIHQNPLKAGLSKDLESWPHQSFPEYLNNNAILCNIDLAKKLLPIPLTAELLEKEAYNMIPEDTLVFL